MGIIFGIFSTTAISVETFLKHLLSSITIKKLTKTPFDLILLYLPKTHLLILSIIARSWGPGSVAPMKLELKKLIPT